MNRQSTPDFGEVLQTVRLLSQHGGLVELRAPNTSKGTVSGYFTDYEKLAQVAVAVSGKAPGVYMTLNPVQPDLLARAANRSVPYARATTTDSDILRRCWMPVDVDAVRPSGISSTETEHQSALARAQALYDYLQDQGFPEGCLVLADSGNGGHVLIRVDLPDDSHSTHLLQRCLQALDLQFSDGAAQVDLVNYNAARIWKVYGTLVAKGDDTAKRPHRLARLITVPEQLIPAPHELLDWLADLAPAAPSADSQGRREKGFDLGDWIVEHQLPVVRCGPWGSGGFKWVLSPCPWNPEHTDNATYIVQHANGAIAAGCHHNGCTGNDWHTLRDLLEPDWRSDRSTRPERPAEEMLEAVGLRASRAVEEVLGGDPGAVFSTDVVAALAMLQVHDPAQWARLRHKLRDVGVLRDLERLIKERAAQQSGVLSAQGADRYVASEQGLVWRPRSPEGGETPVRLTNFDVRIISQVLEDDGLEEHLQFELEANLGGRKKVFRIPAERFSGMAWVVEQLGAAAVVFPGQTLRDHARAAIQLLSGDAPVRRVFTSTGWRRLDTGWVYCHAAGAIGAEGVVPGVETALSGELSRYILPDPLTGASLIEAIRASIRMLDVAPDRVTAPVHAAVYRAPLGGADTSVHLAGPTGCGKTELAALGQQHYGAAMDSRALPGSWSSTSNSLEAQAFLAKDAVLVVDDFASTGSTADVQRLHREADRLLRAQGNHSGRGRMRPDSSLRPPRPPRGLIVSTGEDLPRGQSLGARLMPVGISTDDLRWDQLTDCQADAAKGLYAQAMAGYLRWLAFRYEDIQAHLREEHAELRGKALQGGHRRNPSNFASLALGVRYFLAYAEESGAVGKSESDALWTRCWQALNDVAADQVEHLGSADPAQRFLELVPAALASGRAHIASAGGREPPLPAAWGWRPVEVGVGDSAHTEWRPQGSRIGWLDQGELYLEPDAAYAEVQRMSREGGSDLGIGLTTLTKRLHERGSLATTTEGNGDRRLRVQRTLEGQRRRVIHLRQEALYPQKPVQPVQSVQSVHSEGSAPENSSPLHRSAAPEAPGGDPKPVQETGAPSGSLSTGQGKTAPVAPVAPEIRGYTQLDGEIFPDGHDEVII